MPQLSRRRFSSQLATVTLAGATAAARSAAIAEQPSPAGWIDAHVHVWSPDTLRYPLASGYRPADMQPASFTAAELLQHCRPAGVARIVLIQMSFYELDHRYVLEVMSAHPGVFSAVALIDHRTDEGVDRAGELVQQGVRGFRLHSHGDARDWVTSGSMHRLWRMAAQQRFAVCPLINPEDIRHVAALCRQFPDTTVVIDHFARIGLSGTIETERLDELCRLAELPQVYVKTSAFYALGQKRPPYRDLLPMIRRVLDAFGPERLMWATDCPFQVQGEHTYQASLDLILHQADFLSATDKQWLLRDTADKVFFS